MASDCPLCHGHQRRPVCTTRDFLYGIPGVYSQQTCLECGHVYLHPRPTDAALMQCYPADYSPHQTASAHLDEPTPRDRITSIGQTSHSSKRGIVRTLFRQVPGLRRFLNWLGQEQATIVIPPHRVGQSRLLEIGCAHGGYLERAQTAGWIVDGVEPSSAAADRARSRGFHVHIGTLDSAPLENESREAVAMWMVLEHVPDPRTTLTQIYQRLTPGGMLLFSVPNGSSIETRLFGRYWLHFDVPRHLHVFRKPVIKRLLTEVGYIDVQIIHQASLRTWFGAIAAWGKDRYPLSAWPDRWMNYFRDQPPTALRWLALVPAKLLAMVGQSAAITVVAKKPG